MFPEQKAEAGAEVKPAAEAKPEVKPEAKPGEGEQKPEVKPEVVPLTLADLPIPEGFQPNETVRNDFLTIMNNRALSPKDQASALINLQAKLQTEASAASSKQVAEMQQKWQDEIRADPKYGGDKLEGHLANISRSIDQHGTPATRQTFEYTGAGNNPDIIRYLANLTAQLAEPGKPVLGMPGAQPRTAAEVLYPNQGKT